MNGKANRNVRWGARVVSFLLIAGGILGVMLAVALIRNFAHQHQPYRIIVPVISIVVFVWCALKAIDLWLGKPSGYKWATILFALQIPAFSISRLSYEFSTGASARVLFGHSSRRFGADIGSSLNFLISPEPQGWMLGINFVAVIVLIYLLMVSPPNKTSQATPVFAFLLVLSQVPGAPGFFR